MEMLIAHDPKYALPFDGTSQPSTSLKTLTLVKKTQKTTLTPATG